MAFSRRLSAIRFRFFRITESRRLIADSRPKNKNMETKQKNNPLHGVTLENIVNHLVAYYGWEKLGELINIRCFNYDPNVKSSLSFLRKTPWARTKVELLYMKSLRDIAKAEKLKIAKNNEI